MRVVGDDLQNWGRQVLTLMNSTELSVRSMSVDFIVSLLGGVYNEIGSVDVVSLAFMTVLPEVAAREIALYHLSGLTETMDDVEVTLWPIRRAFADVEETNPDDDDRVDRQLVPSITTLCRTGQAILDGVLVELRLKGFNSADLLKKQASQSAATTSSKGCCQLNKTLFDADEESVLEAASFFFPETSMPQKVRWLLTLRDLHISKSQWAEAAETLILAANTMIDSLPHLSETWRPWQFDLWNNFKSSPWLASIGLPNELQALGNETVAEFSSSFLEPTGLTHASTNRISIEKVSTTLSSIVDQAFLAFDQECGSQDMAYDHFESLLNKLSPMIANNNRNFRSQDVTFLRHVRGSICAKLARLDKDSNKVGHRIGPQKYVRVILRGTKPIRFKESTTIPTYLEWNSPSICRVPVSDLSKAKQAMSKSPMKSEDECICSVFAEKYISALKAAGDIVSVILRIGDTSDISDGDPNTFLDIAVVQMKQQSRSSVGKSRKFVLKNSSTGVVSFGITEFNVAHKFPHALSRQRSLTNSVVAGRI
jgi:hypothetical protein